MKAILFTDIDNTLFDWINYFGPCFRAMIHALSYATKISEEELYRQFKEVYVRFETAEYRHAIQELEFSKHLSSDELERLLRIGFVAFSRARRGRLTPYSSVIPTLTSLRRQGVTIVGITNSWVHDALGRIRTLRLGKLIDILVAWNGENAKGGQPKIRRKNGLTPELILVPSSGRKPDSYGYEKALSLLRCSAPLSLWALGDSIANDLVPAKAIGAKTIWARYGHQFDRINYETIVRITHWDRNKIESTYAANLLEPDFVIEDFSELQHIIPATQSSLFPATD